MVLCKTEYVLMSRFNVRRSLCTNTLLLLAIFVTTRNPNIFPLIQCHLTLYPVL